MQERQRSQRCTRPHRAYHRRERLFEQQIACAHVRAEHDGRIIGFSFEIDVMIGSGGESDLQIRLFALHLQQARHQPAHRAGWGFEPDHGLLAPGLVRHGQQLFKGGLQLRKQGAALRGEAQAARVAFKQRKTKPRLKGGNLAADGPLRQAKFRSGVRKIQMTRGD